MVVGHMFGAAFELDDANGPAVIEVLARDIRSYVWFLMIRKPEHWWTIPSNIKELKVPESDANALVTLDLQGRRMDNKLVQTNSLLRKALIPLLILWISMKILKTLHLHVVASLHLLKSDKERSHY